MKRMMLLVTFMLPLLAMAAEETETPTMSPDQLQNYPFEGQPSPPPEIGDLSVGQQYMMKTQRQEVRDLLSQRLGIVQLKGDTSDLHALQQLYDRKVLKDDAVREWQAVGVVFGDILANEFDLHWVRYADEAGVSKALQWKDTRNFVFPVTLFSKRLQFGEKIDMQAVYDKLSKDIGAFRQIPGQVKP